mmetsp:Transcript_8995/g.8357  ORF Transcript_8995/g.8357 Transcript_8995/m.8357 type:complete len:145 (+) Transcript_8995:1744-2178(+)
MWEESRDYQKAIDRYLEITEDHFPNRDYLEEIWTHIFNLAMTYSKDRVQEVVAIVGDRLLKVEKFGEAAEMYESVGHFERAIQAFMQVDKYDRALDCAAQVKPVELSNMMKEKIMNEKKNMLINKGKVSKIVESGDVSGLEILA